MDLEGFCRCAMVNRQEALSIDFTQPASILKAYAQPPLLSSQRMTPSPIHIGYYRQPAHATPEYAPAHFMINLHLGTPLMLHQRWSDGQVIRELQTCGDVSLYPANYALQESWDRAAEFLEIYLEPALINRVAAELYDGHVLEILPRPIVRDPLIHQLGLVLRTELDSLQASYNQLYVDSIATVLVGHLLRQYATKKINISPFAGGLSAQTLKTVLTYIHDHLDQPLSLQDLATVAQLGSHYFISLFKQSVGQTPHQYITAMRIERAKQLLSQSRWTIAQVGQQVGFQCQSHFTKVFRAQVGVTPKQYRD
jgi:AraC family transcriptional regulator